MKTLLAILLSVALLTQPAFAAFETKAKQAVLVDVTHHVTLLDKDAQSKMFPSSMSKLMTLYMVFERLKQGALKLDDTFVVSEKAWRMQGSKMFVHVGDTVPVEALIRGISVQSGNDACVVVAEGIAGSEEAFAELMNKKAAEIGLKGSHFTNSTGWPDGNHYMTAMDLAILGQRLIEDFPDYYHYFAEPSFSYNNITQHNRNLLLNRGVGVDGLKTGHTEIAGYGITVSAKDEVSGRRVVLVVNGLTSEKERAEEAELIVRHAFRDYREAILVKSGTVVATADVWLGQKETVDLMPAEDVKLLIAQGEQEAATYALRYNGPVAAPVNANQPIGELVIRMAGRSEQVVPLFAKESVARRGFFGRVFYRLGL